MTPSLKYKQLSSLILEYNDCSKKIIVSDESSWINKNETKASLMWGFYSLRRRNENFEYRIKKGSMLDLTEKDWIQHEITRFWDI